jgi:hypothetical protein
VEQPSQSNPFPGRTAQRHTLTSRDVGLTENALRALLASVLADTGLDYYQWVALNAASGSESPLTPDGLIGLLVQGLKIDEERARVVIADLQNRGDFDSTDSRTVVVTAQGNALYERLTASLDVVTAQMYDGLDVDDLAVAYEVLATLAERANAMLAHAS